MHTLWMTRVAAASAALVVMAGSLAFVSVVGLVAGSLVGERFLGNAEPMIETMLGGLVGFALGGAVGGTLAVWVYRATARWLGSKRS